MAESRKKSRKRSGGKARPHKNFQIYLDENLCNCQPILDVLGLNRIKVYRHLQHFPSGTLDRDWLPFVGHNKLVLLTTDKRFRYNEIERVALQTYNIKCFEFSGNSLGAQGMANALGKALPKMMRLRRTRKKCFVASISPFGQIRVMWDSKKRKKKNRR
jgi:hypothetical protein